MARSRPTEQTDDHRRRILDAAEVVLRRHGPAKTTVTDVARELGQTHASVYRYFASKAELIDALVARWLAVVVDPLAAIAQSGAGTATERLHAWLLTLLKAKVAKVTGDPEHFAIYHAIALESRELVDHHVARLVAQIESIIVAGIAAGEFRVADPRAAAAAFLNATYRFHHPALIAPPAVPPPPEAVEDIFALLVAGLRAGVL